MENVAEAIKLAGFTLLFVTALSIAMITIMQGKRTSETIINYSDKTKYYSDIQIVDDNSTSRDRTVELKDIIPTLYRYDQEQYIVLFNDSNGTENDISDDKPLQIFEGIINHRVRIGISGTNKDMIAYLNYNLEAKLEESWTRNHNTIKDHVGDVVEYLFNNYNNRRFKETISTTNEIYKNNVGINNSDLIESDDDTQNDKNEIRVITYTLQPENP